MPSISDSFQVHVSGITSGYTYIYQHQQHCYWLDLFSMTPQDIDGNDGELSTLHASMIHYTSKISNIPVAFYFFLRLSLSL